MEITKKEMANMRNNSEKLAGLKGRVKIAAAFVETAEDVDQETGEVVTRKKGYIKTSDGKYYGTISPTAIRSLEDAIDILDDGEPVEIEVVTRKSGRQRDFISLDLY